MATLINQNGQTLTVPDAVAGDYLAQGWRQPGDPEPAPARSTEPDSSWTVAELKEHAETAGIDLGSARKKDAILDAIAAGSGGDETP